MKCAIIGAGIGGLAAALSLSRKGITPVIHERSAALEEAGAGIQLSPNAMRVIHGLGLAEAVAPHISEPTAIVIRRSTDGRVILDLPLANARARWGAPYATIRRTDLQAVLAAAVEQAGVPIQLGTVYDPGTLAAARETAVRFETVAGGQRVAHEVDVLVGADGLWSCVRQRLGFFGMPVFARKRAHRAIVACDALPGHVDPSVTGLWLGEDAHLVTYPVEGGRAINIVAVVRDRDGAAGWSRPSRPGEVETAFRDWARPAREVIASAGAYHSWPLFDRPPDPTPVRGRTALIGDAAHPMLPFVAQGGAMAIEDAAVLADALSHDALGITARLQRYGSQRLPRTTRVQREARSNGERYHWGFPKSAARDVGLGLLGSQRMLERYDWLYGWKSP